MERHWCGEGGRELRVDLMCKDEELEECIGMFKY